MSLELDPRLTFDSYIVGTANRLAAAAARRVAEAPGSAYNPLFIYSGSGLGKTHLITAIGNHIVRAHRDLHVIYDTLDHLMESVMEAIQAGERDAFRSRLRNASVLLLDDVQFLAGRRGAQDELLRAWDGLLARGGQVVLASDRPPVEIDGLDQRLLSRFSGGLLADLSQPDYETRVAIVRKKAEEHGQLLQEGVAEALARLAFGNVRELQGGLNRVLAVQELDGRAVGAFEVMQLLGITAAPSSSVRQEELEALLNEAVGPMVDSIPVLTAEQIISDAVLRWESEGYVTTRLEAALGASLSMKEAEALVVGFDEATTRLAGIADTIRQLDPAAAELSRLDVLRNPDRMADAESIFELVRERMRPLPQPPAAPTFDQLELDGSLLAVRAARLIAQQPGDRYNPLFVHALEGAGTTSLVTATALLFMERQPGAAVAFITGEAFSAELIQALTQNHVESWRARYRRARLIVIDGVDALMGTERAQEELFHFFDTARRTGVQLVFTASVPPRDLGGLEERLRTRLEGGLVVNLDPERAADVDATPMRRGAPTGGEDLALVDDDIVHPVPASTGHVPGPGAVTPQSSMTGAPEATASRQQYDDWFLDREKILWQWPYITDGVVEELE
jgi:chromosomal replication initiator protein